MISVERRWDLSSVSFLFGYCDDVNAIGAARYMTELIVDREPDLTDPPPFIRIEHCQKTFLDRLSSVVMDCEYVGDFIPKYVLEMNGHPHFFARRNKDSIMSVHIGNMEGLFGRKQSKRWFVNFGISRKDFYNFASKKDDLLYPLLWSIMEDTGAEFMRGGFGVDEYIHSGATDLLFGKYDTTIDKYLMSLSILNSNLLSEANSMNAHHIEERDGLMLAARFFVCKFSEWVTC